MKQYRCPWCGRLGMPKSLHLFRFIPPIGRYSSLYYNKVLCVECNKTSNFAPKSYNTHYYLVVALIVSVLFLLTDIFLIKSIWLTVVSLILLLINLVIVVLVRSKSAILKRDMGEDKLPTPFEVALDTPLKLNIETIFSVRLKNIVPGAVVAKSSSLVKADLVEEYKNDGAPVYVETNSNGNYRIGLLNPEFYNLDVFEIGTEFEVLGVEGEVISTGRIESVSTEIPKE